MMETAIVSGRRPSPPKGPPDARLHPGSFDTPPGLRENLPTPQLGPEQLLVRVQASSINPVDAFLAAGYLKTMAEHEFPVVLGRDYAGVVEQAGPAATGYAQGDEVYGWLLHANPTVHEGSWAELIAVPHDQSVARRPASIDVAQAGAAPLAALTALAAHDALELGEGATVLVVGASGGVGSFAVQLAAHAGATVLAPGLPEDTDYLAWPWGRRGPGPHRRHRRRRARALSRRGRRPARPGLL
jgi:NADPH2:quinone reductase